MSDGSAFLMLHMTAANWLGVCAFAKHTCQILVAITPAECSNASFLHTLRSVTDSSLNHIEKSSRDKTFQWGHTGGFSLFPRHKKKIRRQCTCRLDCFIQ